MHNSKGSDGARAGALGRWALKRTSVWLLFTLFSLPVLALGAFVAWQFYKVTDLDSSTETMMAGDQRGQEMLEVVRNLLSKDVLAGVLVERTDGGTWCSADGALLCNDIVLALQRLPSCVEVRSLTSTTYPGLENKKPVMKELLPLRVADPAEWPRREAFLTSHPLAKNFILSEDGKIALFVGVFQREMPTHAERAAFRAEIHAAIEPFRELADIQTIGLELAQAEIVDGFLRDGFRFGVAFLILSAILLLVVFRHPLICLLTLGYLASGIGVLAGVFWMNRHLPNLYTAILAPLVLGLQLTFLTHLFSAWQRRLRRGLDGRSSLAGALREVFAPSAVAAVTTVIGLLSLVLSPVEIVRTIGLFGAEAVGLMFLGTFLPALVMRVVRPPTQTLAEVSPAPARPSAWFGRWWPGILITGVALAAIPGLLRVKPDIRAMAFMDPASETYYAADLINERMGGLYMFVLDIQFDRPFGAQELPMLAYQERLRKALSEIDGVGEVYAYSQVFTLLNYELKNGRADYSTLPGMLSMMLVKTTVNSLDFPYKDQLQNPDASRVSMFVRSSDMPSEAYLKLIDKVMDTAQASRPPGVTIEARSGVQSFLQGQQAIVDSLGRTLGVSLFSVFLCLTLLWRSPRCGLAGLLVALPPLLVMGGLMGFLGIALNAITVMLGALILGVAVDDAVHVVDHFRRLRRQGGMTTSEAASAAVRRKLQAMTCTSGILVVLFGLLGMSSFPPVAAFGMLAAVALAVAYVSALFVLPVVLRVLFSS